MKKIKYIKRQDSGFKLSSGNSGETSLNLSNEIFDFISKGNLRQGDEKDITFRIYKEDCIKAMSFIIMKLPLYKSSSKDSDKVEDYLETFGELYSRISTFFGNNKKVEYKVNLFYRKDGRVYLKGLRVDGFSIRDYLVENYSALQFDDEEDDVLNLRILSDVEDKGDDESFWGEQSQEDSLISIKQLPAVYRPFITAIKSKPFLLLAGISGTGKSRIVRELAFMTCPKELQDEDGTTPGNYCMIEVKPNWHDSTELLGYYSSFNGGGYRFTKFDRFVVKAWLNPDVPFFVCLDEMNLAPVEQYFAEFLSVLETRSRDKEGNVVTGALVDKQYFKDDTKMTTELGLDKGDDWTIKVRSDLVNKGLTLPPNLIVIGTVNMDDTTYQFSRKVIDRAMTIEMNGGELSQMFGNSNSLKYRSDEDVVKLGMFKAPYINADEVIERYQSQAQIIKEKLPEKLEAVNTALKDTPFQVSYRVLNELVIYLGALMDEATAKGEPIDDDALPTLIDKAMDQITLMKILPRIEGDEDMFRRSGGTNVLKTLQSLFSEESDSHKKLEEMADRLDRTGFTRFWP